MSAETQGPSILPRRSKAPGDHVRTYPAGPDGPYGNPRATVLVSPAACAGCLKKHCDHWTCMGELTPDQVYDLYRKKEEKACN